MAWWFDLWRWFLILKNLRKVVDIVWCYWGGPLANREKCLEMPLHFPMNCSLVFTDKWMWFSEKCCLGNKNLYLVSWIFWNLYRSSAEHKSLSNRFPTFLIWGTEDGDRNSGKVTGQCSYAFWQHKKSYRYMYMCFWFHIWKYSFDVTHFTLVWVAVIFLCFILRSWK